MKTTSYIILASNNKTGEIKGYIEHSFSMSFSDDRVRVDRLFELTHMTSKPKVKAITYLLKTCAKLTKKSSLGKGWSFNYYKVGSKNCPVKIDWREIVMMKLDKKSAKFIWRNLKFTKKDLVVSN